MSIDHQQLIDLLRKKLHDLYTRASQAIEQMDDSDMNWRPNEESNSVANLVIHMAGNLRQRLISGIGGALDDRDREAEFSNWYSFTRDSVLEILQLSFGEAETTLDQLAPERLSDTQRIRSREVTVLDVLFTVATHMSEHVGQILYIAKLRLGARYRVLSIPRQTDNVGHGASNDENRSVHVNRASLEEKFILRNLVELCKHDYSEFEQTDVGDTGLFGYKWLDHYWTEPSRHPFLLRVGERLAGFALVGNINDTMSDVKKHSMAEFFILRKYRCQGIGRKVATSLFDLFPGTWVVAQEKSNAPAQAFWRKVISNHTGGRFHVLTDERYVTLEFECP